MRFSIITITYNAEKYLQKTLQSVVEQQFSSFEHIVWDGGSTDGTLEIIGAFPHVKLYQGKDVGISDAMNRGASFTQGEFLLHLHADDILAHAKALLFVDTALKQHPEAKWLYGQANIIDEDGMIKETPHFQAYNYKRLKKYNCIAHPATFVSRELFLAQGGFDIGLRYAMDYDLWLRLGKTTPAFALRAVLSCFREHENSLSTACSVEVAKEAYFVRNRHLTSFIDRVRSYRTYKRRLRKCS